MHLADEALFLQTCPMWNGLWCAFMDHRPQCGAQAQAEEGAHGVVQQIMLAPQAPDVSAIAIGLRRGGVFDAVRYGAQGAAVFEDGLQELDAFIDMQPAAGKV
jgi:hypothetical protein